MDGKHLLIYATKYEEKSEDLQDEVTLIQHFSLQQIMNL